MRHPRATLQRPPQAEPGKGAGSAQVEVLEAEGIDVAWVREIAASPRAAEPADARPHFQSEPLRGPAARAALAEVAALVARSLPDGGGLNLEGVSLHLREGSNTLNFGPSAVRVVRSGSQVEVSLAPKAEAAGTPLVAHDGQARLPACPLAANR